MAYLNKVYLMGNLGKDPEIRTFQSGGTCATFSLATSKRYRDRNGEQKDETQWHTVKVLGKSAETLQQLGVKKGAQMLVEGEIAYRSWTDQATGQKRTATEIVAFTFQLVGSRQQSQGNGNAATYDYSHAAQQPAQQQEEWQQPEGDDDLPF
jgi:single-strand DNA-binding protein